MIRHLIVSTARSQANTKPAMRKITSEKTDGREKKKPLNHIAPLVNQTTFPTNMVRLKEDPTWRISKSSALSKSARQVMLAGCTRHSTRAPKKRGARDMTLEAAADLEEKHWHTDSVVAKLEHD